MATTAPRLALTLGDPAGIGPEILLKAFAQAPEVLRGCFIVGDLGTLARAREWLGPSIPPLECVQDPTRQRALPEGVVPVFQAVTKPSLVTPGEVSAQAGAMAAECVLWAARAALRGEIDALVTAPVHKQALSAAGVAFPGHTEMLQAEAARHLGVALATLPVRMMLANPELRTVLVSIHVSLREAIAAVTFDHVLDTLRITHVAETRALGRPPRIALAGLNPHAGEGGLMGREELDILVPVLQAARAEGLDVQGPLSPDTVFMRARHAPGHPGEFDVVVAMYHDQGLIPVKYLGVEQGVNVTLGLPLVRTSPDHGTAFDLAGTGLANPASLIQAIRMAQTLSGCQFDAK
jgi:4-hydroxythreonine-4-phosphate dehydrogenase